MLQVEVCCAALCWSLHVEQRCVFLPLRQIIQYIHAVSLSASISQNAAAPHRKQK